MRLVSSSTVGRLLGRPPKNSTRPPVAARCSAADWMACTGAAVITTSAPRPPVAAATLSCGSAVVGSTTTAAPARSAAARRGRRRPDNGGPAGERCSGDRGSRRRRRDHRRPGARHPVRGAAPRRDRRAGAVLRRSAQEPADRRARHQPDPLQGAARRRHDGLHARRLPPGGRDRRPGPDRARLDGLGPLRPRGLRRCRRSCPGPGRAQGRRQARPLTEDTVMMKPGLLPVHLEDVPSETFVRQLAKLKELTSELVDWLEPAHIDRPVPAGTSAVVVPDLSGLAYRMVEKFRRIDVPILLLSTEFGTVLMWDWEIPVSYTHLRAHETV